MDARAGLALSLALIVTAAASRCSADALDVPAALVEARAEGSVDESLLLALDELLMDPVALEGGSVERLRLLPWLDAEHIEALRRARPPRSLVELAGLPGWDAERAQRSAPFVRFAPSTSRPPNVRRGALRTAWLRARRDVLVDVTQAPLRFVARGVDSRSDGRSAALAAETSTLRGVAGDMRLRHAQGLLWWSGDERLRATSPAVRSASGILLDSSLQRERVVRGLAVETRGALGVRVLLGTNAGDDVRIVTAATPTRAGRFEAGMVRVGTRAWWGGAWRHRRAHHDATLEVAGRAGRWAARAGATWRTPRTHLRGRLEGSEPFSLSPGSTASAVERRSTTRRALLQTGARWRSVRLDLGLVQSSRREGSGKRRDTLERQIQVAWRQRPHAVEARLRLGRWGERDVGLEDFASPDEGRTSNLLLRFRTMPRATTTLSLEYRALDARHTAQGTTDLATAWVVRIEQRARRLTWVAIASSYVAPSGRAVPYAPEPPMPGTFSSTALRGDGFRLASGAALRLGGAELRVRAGSTFEDRGQTDSSMEAALALSLD